MVIYMTLENLTGESEGEDLHAWVRGVEGLVESAYVGGKPLGRSLANQINKINRERGRNYEIVPEQLVSYIHEEKPELVSKREKIIGERKNKQIDGKKTSKGNSYSVEKTPEKLREEKDSVRSPLKVRVSPTSQRDSKQRDIVSLTEWAKSEYELADSQNVRATQTASAFVSPQQNSPGASSSSSPDGSFPTVPSSFWQRFNAASTTKRILIGLVGSAIALYGSCYSYNLVSDKVGNFYDNVVKAEIDGSSRSFEKKELLNKSYEDYLDKYAPENLQIGSKESSSNNPIKSKQHYLDKYAPKKN